MDRPTEILPSWLNRLFDFSVCDTKLYVVLSLMLWKHLLIPHSHLSFFGVKKRILMWTCHFVNILNFCAMHCSLHFKVDNNRASLFEKSGCQICNPFGWTLRICRIADIDHCFLNHFLICIVCQYWDKFLIFEMLSLFDGMMDLCLENKFSINRKNYIWSFSSVCLNPPKFWKQMLPRTNYFFK